MNIFFDVSFLYWRRGNGLMVDYQYQLVIRSHYSGNNTNLPVIGSKSCFRSDDEKEAFDELFKVLAVSYRDSMVKFTSTVVVVVIFS